MNEYMIKPIYVSKKHFPAWEDVKKESEKTGKGIGYVLLKAWLDKKEMEKKQ